MNPDLRDLKNGDMVVVTGDWIYDSGHAGWNEIHAVHSCQRMSGSDGVILATYSGFGNPVGLYFDAPSGNVIIGDTANGTVSSIQRVCEPVTA